MLYNDIDRIFLSGPKSWTQVQIVATWKDPRQLVEQIYNELDAAVCRLDRR